MSESKEKCRRIVHSIVGGVFLIGLAVLFYFKAFWPWILALIGIIVILKALLGCK